MFNIISGALHCRLTKRSIIPQTLGFSPEITTADVCPQAQPRATSRMGLWPSSGLWKLLSNKAGSRQLKLFSTEIHLDILVMTNAYIVGGLCSRCTSRFIYHILIGNNNGKINGEKCFLLSLFNFLSVREQHVSNFWYILEQPEMTDCP